MNAFRVAPDGAIFDRVAEFAFEKDTDRFRTLFAADPNGYIDALAKLVQTLASSERLVGGSQPGVTSPAIMLKQRLAAAGRLEFSEFFDPAPTAKEERLAAARSWLLGFWDSICEELENPDSEALTAMIGHLNREAYYFWVRRDPNWLTRLVLPDDEVMRLRPCTLKTLGRSVETFLARHGVSAGGAEVERWVEVNVTLHFRTFAEYWRFFGKTGDEYVPARTRSSLGFLLGMPSRRSSIVRVVMPFIGLDAVRRVRNRGELVERVLEWADSEGREAVEGLRTLQALARAAGDERERQRRLEDVRRDVEAILKLPLSRERLIELNLAKPEIPDAITWSRLSESNSYRWLWRFREPDLDWVWRKKITELLS
jgi:hypothetical protein